MKKKTRIFWLLYRSYLLVALISLVAVSWYISGSVKAFYLEQFKSDLQIRGILLSGQIRPLLTPLEHKKLQDLCIKNGLNSGTRITVVLPNGQVVGDTDGEPFAMDNHLDRPEIRKAIVDGTGVSIRYSGTLDQNMMYVAMAITSGTDVTAILRTSIPTTKIDKEIKTLQYQILLVGVVAAILISLLSLFVTRRISQPIETLKQGAERFAAGELEHRLIEPGTLEFDSLAETMNQMALQLKDRMEAIINQRNEYETVLSNMLGGVIALDLQQKILSVNPSAAGILKLDPDRCKGQNLQEAARIRELNDFVNQAVHSETTIARDLVAHLPEKHVISVRSAPLRNTEKERTGTLLVLNDVSQLRLLENMRRDFAANVSHELKTPLTTIKGFTETLLDDEDDDMEKTRRFLGIIQKHVDRINAIIDGLLQLSKIETTEDQVADAFTFESIQSVVNAVVGLCETKASEKKILIKTEDKVDLKIPMDSALLQQALLNLVENALEYSPASSSIEVNCRTAGDWVQIAVSDHGIGIKEKHLERLFERFYRVDQARSRTAGGTGLGLAIAKHIAMLHKGHITVNSTIGQGSTFTLHLPKA